MIIVEQPSWLRLVFRMHGSAFPRIWRRVLFITAIAVVFTRLQKYPTFHYSLSLTPFLLVGLPLGIILGFRNTAAYDRYWEGRKLWGALVNVSRTLTRQIMTLVVAKPGSDEPTADEIAARHRELCLRTIAFVHAVRLQLRRERTFEELADLLPPGEVASFGKEPNPAAAILHGTGVRLLAARQAGLVEPVCYPLLEGSLAQLTDVLGACERIKNTPAPVGYAIFIHRAVAMYCLLLPFGVADAIGVLTPLVAFFVAYAFFSLDAIGDALEDPFRIDQHHLPLTAISRNIEIYVRARLGETDLPPVLTPRNGILD